jgi:hypothetical protein
MATKDDLCDWIVEAVRALHGSAKIVPICKYIWEHHEQDLRNSGDLFYIWQYEMRWAGQKLRNDGTLMPAFNNRNSLWELKKK